MGDGNFQRGKLTIIHQCLRWPDTPNYSQDCVMGPYSKSGQFKIFKKFLFKYTSPQLSILQM